MWTIISVNRVHLPDSDENNYYVDSKLFNYQDTELRFDPIKAQNRVTLEEFSFLHKKIGIEFGQQLLNIKIFNIILIIFDLIAIVYWLLFILYLLKFSIGYLWEASILTIIAFLLWLWFVKYRTDNIAKIQTILNELNQIKYQNRGLFWTIEPRWGRFLRLDLNYFGVEYQPPEITTSYQQANYGYGIQEP